MPQRVDANRAALQKVISTKAVFLKQVHGIGVEQLSHSTSNGTVADACITAQHGLACTIMVADCLPVLLTNVAGTAVAAAHAGWRGLAGYEGKGVLEAVFSAFQVSNRPVAQVLPSQEAPEIIAWLGPAALVAYLMGTPARKRAIKKREAEELAAARAMPLTGSGSGEPDTGSHAPGGVETIAAVGNVSRITAVRKEP